jgi:hypothetical protein
MGINIKKWMLAVPALAMILSACEKELLDNKSGKEVLVRVRLVGITEGGEEDLTRSDSMKESEMVSTSIGDGMLLEMQMERDTSALRATKTQLDNNSLFRVVALKHNTTTFISYGDYKGDGTPVAGGLHVPINGSYDFVCYSYDSSTLPAAPTQKQDDNISTTINALQGAKDLLWTKINKDVTDVAPELEILLSRVMVRVKLVLDLSYNKWTITGVSGNLTLGLVGIGGTISLANGTVASNTGTPTFSSWTGSGYQWESSTELLVMPRASGTTVSIPKNAITRQSLSAIPSDVATTTFSSALKSGFSYRLLVRLRIPIWARSNIYWDDVTDSSKPKLTFVPADGVTDYQGYQGVYFKWGSLVGISPVGWGFSGTTDIYVPIVKNPLNTSTWKATTGSTMAANNTDFPNVTSNWNTWGNNTANATDIPYLDPVNYRTAGSVAFGVYNQYAMDAERNVYDVYKNFRGDICQYLSTKTGVVSGDYRLPMSSELGIGGGRWDSSDPTTTPTSDGWVKGTGSFGQAYGASFANGRADWLSENGHGGTPGVLGSAINKTMWNVVFPASGSRNSTGEVPNTDQVGLYWSGSVHTDITTSYRLYFHDTAVVISASSNRSEGYPIRCVKN